MAASSQIRVSLHLANGVPSRQQSPGAPSSPKLLHFRAGASNSRAITSGCSLFAELVSSGPSRRCSVTCQSTNGNGRPVNGSSELPAYETFDQAGVLPLGQGWDPWKRASSSPGAAGEADISVRSADGAGTTTGGRYGPVGNEGEEPFRILADGRKAYLDELDVLTLLAPPPFLKPMSSTNYNHAAFLWKKIAAIPEERRHRLLDLLEPRHISAMWKMAELRYEDPRLVLQNASRFLLNPAVEPLQPIFWTGQVNEVPSLFNWLSRFKKAFFYSGEKELYGRVAVGGPWLEGLANKVAPLYFRVRPVRTVAATNEQCDFAFSYNDGHLELRNAVPNGFPQPGKQPGPFGKEFFDYIRVVGPGVVVGQSWFGPLSKSQDPKNPGVAPRKYLGEFVLIQNYEDKNAS